MWDTPNWNVELKDSIHMEVSEGVEGVNRQATVSNFVKVLRGLKL